MKHDPDWYYDTSEDVEPIPKEDPLWSFPESRKAASCLRTRTSILPKNCRRANKLTRSKLRKRTDWLDWRNSEHKQLQQYEAQSIFGEPCMRSPNANALPFLWTYTIKSAGTLKARGVCNGSKLQLGLVTIRNTYAGSFDHTGVRLFWSTAASKESKELRSRC